MEILEDNQSLQHLNLSENNLTHDLKKPGGECPIETFTASVVKLINQSASLNLVNLTYMNLRDQLLPIAKAVY